MKIANAALLVSLAFATNPMQAAQADHFHVDEDSAVQGFVLLDQLELRDSDSGTGFGWHARGWIGSDLVRLWIRSAGDVASGDAEAADVEVLYGRSVSTWWDLVAGIRQDFGPGESQTFGAIGIQGLAPQRIELATTLYLGQGQQSAARFSAEYEMLFTNRLVLQPRLEADLYGKTDADRGIGSGLSSVEAGLRLRYEFTRQFAPYIGVDWARASGKTAELRRASSARVDDLRLVAGVRAWF